MTAEDGKLCAPSNAACHCGAPQGPRQSVSLRRGVYQPPVCRHLKTPGRLFDAIDTNTREQDLLKKEPSLVCPEGLKRNTAPKGVLIQTENGKAAHITVLSRQWSCLCQP